MLAVVSLRAHSMREGAGLPGLCPSAAMAVAAAVWWEVLSLWIVGEVETRGTEGTRGAEGTRGEEGTRGAEGRSAGGAVVPRHG